LTGATALAGATALILTAAALTLAIGLPVAVGLRRLTARPLLLGIGVAVGIGIGLALFALAPTLVVALDETTLALDHAVVVVGVLPVRLGRDAIAR